MDDKRELERLLKNIQIGLEKYSIRELNEALVGVLGKNHEKRPEIDFVITSVAEHYNITVRMLKKAQTRGIEQEAKQVCYCLLNMDLRLPVRYISSRIFFNWPNSVRTGIKRLKSVNLAIKQDDSFFNSYITIQKKLNKYLTQKLKIESNGSE